jgi:hypothetical protein
MAVNDGLKGTGFCPLHGVSNGESGACPICGSIPGAIPESGEEYPVRTFRIAGSTDSADTSAEIARYVAEAVEYVSLVDGSNITFGDGRWKGGHQFGFTVAVSVNVTGRPLVTAHIRQAVARIVKTTGYTFYMTYADEVAMEVY